MLVLQLPNCGSNTYPEKQRERQQESERRSLQVHYGGTIALIDP
jgi:hypothetical protein